MIVIQRSSLKTYYREKWMKKNQNRIAELYSNYDERLKFSKKPRFREKGFVNHLWKFSIGELKSLGLTPDGFSSFKTKCEMGII